MLTIIARGVALFVAGRPKAPFVRGTIAEFPVPMSGDERRSALSPRATAALARHRRP